MQVRNIMLFLFLISPAFASSQKSTCLNKTYAFSRSFLGGAPPTDIVEIGGKVVGNTGGKSSKEYFIYLQTCDVSSVTITGLWINGLGYSAKAQKAKTPVVLTNVTQSTKGMKETLVPKTPLTVWEILFSPDETMLKPAASTQKLSASNALVITGYLKGKPFTTTVKNFKELLPVAGQ